MENAAAAGGEMAEMVAAGNIAILAQKAAENAERAAVVRARAAQAARANCGAFCPAKPETCRGTIEVEGFNVVCPAAEDGSCPYASRRVAYQQAQWLDTVGFGEDVWGAEWRQLPDMCRAGLEWIRDNMAEVLSKGRGVIIGGGVGTGKTCAIALLVAQLRGKSVCLLDDVELNEMATQRSIPARAFECDLLVVDDFGTGACPDWAFPQVHRLFDVRYRQNRSTFLTTNLTEDALKANHMLARIYSRLRARNVWLSSGTDSKREVASIGAWAAEVER